MELVQRIVVYSKYKALSMSIFECPVDRLHWLISSSGCWGMSIHQPSVNRQQMIAGCSLPSCHRSWMRGAEITPLTPHRETILTTMSADGWRMVVWPIICLLEIQSIVHEHLWVSCGQAPLIDFFQWMLGNEHPSTICQPSTDDCWMLITIMSSIMDARGRNYPINPPRGDHSDNHVSRWLMDGCLNDQGCSWMLVVSVAKSTNWSVNHQWIVMS